MTSILRALKASTKDSRALESAYLRVLRDYVFSAMRSSSLGTFYSSYPGGLNYYPAYWAAFL